MNVSDQIINVIDALCEKFGIVMDFTEENVIPQLEVLCDKFISYEIYTSVFWIIFVFFICCICWIIFGLTFKGAKEVEWDDCYFITVVNFASGIIAGFLSIAFIIVTGLQVYDIVEAITFPEKTIFDYVSNLISMNS